MEDNILTVSHIHKSFGGVHALEDVSLSVKRGEIFCLAGENGSGKSTLIKVISGYYKPDVGNIVIDGKEFGILSPSESIKNGVQVIYQDFSLFPNLSVMENLALSYELSCGRKIINYKRMKETAKRAAEKINLKVDMSARVGDFSVADRQMIAIARALVSDAKLIIMDEATSALTRKEINKLFEIIKQLKEDGVSTMFVSHKLDEVFEISDRIAIFRNGKNVITCLNSEMDEEKFSYYMTGRKICKAENFRPEGDRSSTELEVSGLTVKGVFENIDFKLYKGEILGITGQLGSGRTELAMSLFGLQKLDKGEIMIRGMRRRIENARQAQKLGLAYVPEDRLTEGLFMPQSLTNNEIVTHLKDVSSKAGFLDKKRAGAEMDIWIEKLSIATDHREKYAQNLSGGNQQKVVLAKWLACNPGILILNGPTVGVDIGAKHDIYQLLRRYADEGMSIIIASDDIQEVVSLCSRVIVLKSGRVSKLICGDEITEQALLNAAI